MKLYHGSNISIARIDLNRSKPYKDFGKGFYLTTIREQALRMAEQTVRKFGGTPFVNEYEFDETFLHNGQMNVKVFNSYSEEWAYFIVANRDRNNKEKSHRPRHCSGSHWPTIGSEPTLSLFTQLYRHAHIDKGIEIQRIDHTVLFRYGTCRKAFKETMTNEETFMIECITTELVEYVIEDFGMDLATAMRMVYNSTTYSKLTDLATGLYYQSPGYVYDDLKHELTNGKVMF